MQKFSLILVTFSITVFFVSVTNAYALDNDHFLPISDLHIAQLVEDDDNPGPVEDDDNPGPIGQPTISLTNPFSGGDSLFALLRTVINEIVLPIGGVLAVLAFVYSGFLYVTAQGNETKLKTAHLALLYTSIGTAVLLGSWVLANLICATIGELGGPICPT